MPRFAAGFHETILARQDAIHGPGSDPPPDQSQGRMAHCGRHLSDLPVLAFMQPHFDPTGWYALADANRRIPFPKSGGLLDPLCARRKCNKISKIDAGAQLLQRHFVRCTLNLDPISLGQFYFRIADRVLKGPVIGQHHQTFAIGIEPPGRIDVRDRDKVLKRAFALAGTELAKHATRLIEEDNVRH